MKKTAIKPSAWYVDYTSRGKSTAHKTTPEWKMFCCDISERRNPDNHIEIDFNFFPPEKLCPVCKKK